MSNAFLALIRKRRPELAVPPAEQAATAIIKVEAEDCPAFFRHYLLPLPRNMRLEIDAKTIHGNRRYTGWLWQWDGKVVGFDPQSVADRILDRDLVPVLEKVCPVIIAADQLFLNSPDSSQYTDKTGQRWMRV